MQKELEEAANEMKVVVGADKLHLDAPILSSSIPSKVHTKFVRTTFHSKMLRQANSQFRFQCRKLTKEK